VDVGKGSAVSAVSDVSDEASHLKILAEVFASSSATLRVGIGDDAAVVAPTQSAIGLSTDMAVEGTHFDREWSTPYEIGGKVAAANLADIFAMGGKPEYLMVAAAIPSDFTAQDLKSLAEGIRDEAAKVNAIVVGGDLVRSSILTLAISVFGEVSKPILRSGAKVGDLVGVSGFPGESSKGLHLLQSGVRDERTMAHRYPTVNYSKIINLDITLTHALTDVSDGLIAELESLAQASEVGIDIDSSKIATDAHTLHGGEDHVFVGTFTSLPEGWIEIGRVDEGSGVRLDGKIITHQGFTHF
jgi:thiamine-monophosphate kinase